MGAVLLNTIWLSIDAEFNKESNPSKVPILFQLVENMFCLFFVCELILRFLAYHKKIECVKDPWFLFDFVLVLFMVLDTWVLPSVFSGLRSGSSMRVLRLFRLFRVMRMLKILQALPELFILLLGMAAAFKSVMYTLLLLIGLTYLFGLIFAQTALDTKLGERYFSTVFEAMYSLLIHGTFMDSVGRVFDDMRADGVGFAVLFFLYILLSALMVLNLLIGVLCEVVSNVSSSQRDAMMVERTRSVLLHIVKNVDQDFDGVITRDEFMSVAESPELIHALMEIGIDAAGIVDVVDEIFANGCLDVDDFMDVILKFRCTRYATLKDVVELRKRLLP